MDGKTEKRKSEMFGRVSMIVIAAFALMFTAMSGSFAAPVSVTTSTAQSVTASNNSDLLVKVGRRHYYRRHYRPWRYYSHRPWRYKRYYYGQPYYYPYYGRPYYYYRRPRPYYRYRRASNRCVHWHRQCVKRWGSKTGNYRGCMKYHRCR